MYFKDDNSYHEMRKSATLQWLGALLKSEDLVSRDSAKVALEYMEYMEKQIKTLEDKNALKDEFLKKLKNKLNNEAKQ